ncbi:MAG: ADP-ribosylglycohydrolase family protein [Sedimentisphaerales bacterium]|nr:ADP-ribosylglycohydrolase family protein [Sedimentisphaerales bacterium]
MPFNHDDYKNKVLGCWLGKNIGGTLGAPMEWWRQTHDVTFYTQDLGGEPIPNDDLDLQLVWLMALEERGLKIDAHDLAEYWLMYITPHYSEYGTAKANLRAGLIPPISGSFRNVYKDSCGAFIRSEIWACIAPGLPEVAAKYAYEDAIVDHGDGEGTYAAVMIAAMQAAAFVISDFKQLIEIGLAYIPENSGVTAAVKTAIASYDAGKSWKQTRDNILENHRGEGGCVLWDRTCAEDKKKGFDKGEKGYMVPSNIAIIVAALLYGQNDFEKTICTAVNFGEDTDCTAATVGALWGIIHGAKEIPQKWIEPIGRTIKTICIANGELMRPLPKTVDELTDRTIHQGKLLTLSLGKENYLNADTTDLSKIKPEDFTPSIQYREMMRSAIGKMKFHFDSFDVFVGLPNGPIPDNQGQTPVTLEIHGRTRLPGVVNFQWHLPPQWQVIQGLAGQTICHAFDFCENANINFTLHCENFTTPSAQCVLALTVTEMAKKMLIPITIINTR